MQFKDFQVIWRPGRLSEPQRIRAAVYLAVVGFASSLAFWLTTLESPGPPWVDASGDVLFLALALGFGLAFCAVASYWLIVLSFHHKKGAYLLVLMSLVMNTILLDAAVDRAEDYQNMAAGILAALIIAVATTQRNGPVLGDSSHEE